MVAFAEQKRGIGNDGVVCKENFAKVLMEGIYGKAKMLYAQSSPFGWTAWNETEWILSLKYTILFGYQPFSKAFVNS